MIGGFHHVAVQVHDVANVVRFYVECLGLSELKRFHRDDGSLRSIWLGVTNDGQRDGPFLAIEQLHGAARGAMGFSPVAPPAQTGFSMVALKIDASKRAGLVQALKRLEIPIEKETQWTIYVRDPEGNLVGLSHHPHDPPPAQVGGG